MSSEWRKTFQNAKIYFLSVPDRLVFRIHDVLNSMLKIWFTEYKYPMYPWGPEFIPITEIAICVACMPVCPTLSGRDRRITGHTGFSLSWEIMWQWFIGKDKNLLLRNRPKTIEVNTGNPFLTSLYTEYTLALICAHVCMFVHTQIHKP